MRSLSEESTLSRMLGRIRVSALFSLLSAASLVLAAPQPSKPPAKAAPVVGVATENGAATQAALAELAAGGNAVDAAIVAALVAGVASPTSSGLGGGGFAVVRMAEDRSTSVLDFRETAPASVDVSAFERRPLPSVERGKLVGVPGEAAGLHELSRRYGKRSWRNLVGPAERLARRGFVVEEHLAGLLRGSDAKSFQRDPGLVNVYFGGGKPAVAGQLVKNPKLGQTLSRLRNEGVKAIYDGAIADDLVATARSVGGALSREDLSKYGVRERPPLVVRWEGYEVATMPPPSAGGLMLAEVLGLYSRSELERAGLAKGLGVHLLAEAMRGASADRSCCVGDPDFVNTDVQKLLDSARLAKRKQQIASDRTHTVPRFLESSHGTHQMVVADHHGNVIALVSTINSSFGADLSGEKSGIVLNDQLDDFTSNADAKKLGVEKNPNAARPFARPVSSMTPTIVFRDGRPVLALGGSGGTAIPANVTQVLLAVLVGGLAPEAAVSAPRFRPTSKDATLLLDEGFPEVERADLAWRGELLRPNTSTASAVQVLAWGEHGISAAADPRKHGRAEVR
ncbi:MAG TPA: gamma-glutamyltransferase family protein [Polyangiaceae bacterium]